MRYEYLLLDADNTIFDFDAAERLALNETLALFGAQYNDNYLSLYHEINIGWWKRLERREVTRDELGVGRFRDLMDKIGLEGCDAAQMNKIYRERLGKHGILLTGVYDVLKLLCGKCQMYIVTNGMSVTQHSRFDESPVRSLVNDIFVSEDIGFDKPDVRYFNAVFDMISQSFPDISKEKCLMVGDSLTSDIKGAENFGIDSVFVKKDGHSIVADKNLPNDIEGAPDYIIGSLSELPGIVFGAGP